MNSPSDSANLKSAIRNLKSAAGAVILAHNYQVPDIYDVADFIGDSLELARQARTVRSRLIVFCGVRFMAETAKLVNPETRVVLAAPDAGCQMADMVTAEALRARKSELGDVTTVAYVNTPAEVKAESDICCTSANAVRVVKSLPADQRILFVPDRHLAAYVAREAGRPLLDSRLPIPDSRLSPAGIIPWEGFCYVHASFRAADVERARKEHPDAFVVVHPECPLEAIDAADAAASTSGMVRLAREHGAIVLGTEAGMCDRVRRDLPQVRCWPLRRSALCRNMKLTRLEDVQAALEGAMPEIDVSAEAAGRARRALDRMMEVPGR
ncbi:quinolinate synthase [candidate division WOR-3 bacterium]|uniref:Quinolinate synthase n=1 Tax=candidate division WOR-3 bacterium TaxID=2052148 RepID=A0A937XK02_UNCW3|nr:quinolinate synthase [candidate division WOR-3 bacterium]